MGRDPVHDGLPVLREILTVLAGILVLLLLTALLGPYVVDWRDWRSDVEARLSKAIGAPVSVAGAIDIRFLPIPRLVLGDVQVSGAGADSHPPAGSAMAAGAPRGQISIEALVLEFAPGDILRGRVKLSDASAEGVVATLPTDGKGAFRLPDFGGELALDRLRINRSAIRLVSPDGQNVSIGPVAVIASAPRLSGPWRIEGEIAGQSLRLVTGEWEADGRTRMRLSLGDGQGRAVFDGMFLARRNGANLDPGFDGTFNASINGEPGGAEPGAAGLGLGLGLGLGGKLNYENGVARLSTLNLAFGDSTARLEGDSQIDFRGDGPSSLSLKGRRLDLDLIMPQLKALASSFSEGRSLREIGLPKIALAIDVEQFVLHGEETGPTSLRGWIGRAGLTEASLGTSLAGARLGLSGNLASLVAGAAALNLVVPDTRRLALALNRMGLEPVLADLLSGFARLDVQASGRLTPGAGLLDQAIVTTPGGRLDASGRQVDGRLELDLRLDGLDIDTVPALSAASALAPDLDLSLAISLSRLRLGPGPLGEARLALSRERGNWSVGQLAASGFGGLVLSGQGQEQAQARGKEGGKEGGKRVTGRVDAPHADTLLALAGPFLPPDLRRRLAGAAGGLSPVSLVYDLARGADGGIAASLSGSAGEAKVKFSGSGAGGQTRPAFDLGLDLPGPGLVYQALGLVRPGRDEAVQLTVRRAQPDGRLAFGLTGKGFSASAESEGAVGGDAERYRVAVDSQSPDLLLPEALARLLPRERLTGEGQLAMGAERMTLEALKVIMASGQARGRLSLGDDGGIEGDLSLPALDLARILELGLGGQTTPALAGAWSSARFQPVAGLPRARIAATLPTLRLGGGMSLADARFDLILSEDGLRLDGLQGQAFAGTIGGNLSLRREGGLVAARGRVALDRIETAQVTGRQMAGRMSGFFEFGGSGETPARLIASLGGSGEARLTEAMIARLDPAALARIVTTTDDTAAESDRARLGQRLAPALDAAPLQLGTLGVSATLSGGVIRLQPVTHASAAARTEISGLIDLRRADLDLRATMTMLGPPPKGWAGPPPQIAMKWSGPFDAVRREIDPAALSNGLAARALAREIERVEAFEADIRERSFFARRLRAEREMREAQARAEEAALREEIQRILDEQKRREDEQRLEELRLEEERAARRDKPLVLPPRNPVISVPPPPQTPAAPLPPPLDIRPLPAPAPPR